MTSVIVIPWMETENPYRKRAAEKVYTHLWRSKIAAHVTGESVRSPGAARNNGVQTARELYPDLTSVCFIDADTIVPHDQIAKAIEWAEADPGLVYGYTVYKQLDEDGRTLRDLTLNGSMGCAAISVECFDKVGGFDEGFVGWGYEDLDFAQRCAFHWPLRRVDGVVTHLWHGSRREDDSPVDSDAEQVAANHRRFQVNAQLNFSAASGGREPVA